MKHLHMLVAVVTILLYLYQAVPIFTGKKAKRSPAFSGMTHLVYTVLMLTGLWLFWQLYQVAGMQH